MIYSVTAINEQGESLLMELYHPESSGINIYNITGIGSPSMDVQTSDLVSSDGSIFASSRAQERLITFTVKPLFNPDVETSRQLTYKYFPVKSKITLIFETDNRISTISGYVKSNNPDIFSKDEELVIEVICPDPWFYRSGDPKNVVFNGTDSMFEFPFSNEKVLDDEVERKEAIVRKEYNEFGRVIKEWTEYYHYKDVYEFTRNLLVMGEIRQGTERIVEYEGDVPTGFTMYIHAAYRPSTDITISNITMGTNMMILVSRIEKITGAPFKQYDDIVIDTKSGNRRVRLLRGGRYYNIVNALDLNSDWLLLQPGTNTMRYFAMEGVEGLEVRIEYVPAYQGV